MNKKKEYIDEPIIKIQYSKLKIIVATLFKYGYGISYIEELLGISELEIHEIIREKLKV